MSSNLQNSIWPNAGGTLGQIKVQIPDGVNTTWPEGDALVHNFVFNKGKLVGFVDTKALIANDSKTTTFPYDYVNISLPSIAEGEMTYNYDQCTYVVLDGEVLKGDVPTDEELEIITKKYIGCKTVDDIKAVDPNYLTNDIIDGVWKEGLGDLMNGVNMFNYCDSLELFTSDLSRLTNGFGMFAYCNNLTSFTSNLSSLTNGFGMFAYCKLDTASVQNIADTIKNVTSLINGSSVEAEVCKQIDIYIGNTFPNEQEEAAFNTIASKGWTVYVNGSEYTPTSPAAITTLDETGQEITAPIPFWAKPVQSNEEHAQYTDSEGNFYNILGGQFIYGDDLSTYGMFTCEADAAANMRLTKIEK